MSQYPRKTHSSKHRKQSTVGRAYHFSDEAVRLEAEYAKLCGEVRTRYVRPGTSPLPKARESPTSEQPGCEGPAQPRAEGED